MRPSVLAIALSLALLAPAAFAAHSDGKGARSLGGTTVPRTEEWITLETDAFPEKPLGRLENDPAATGGKAWNLSTYGFITTTIDVPETGVAWIDIRARGWHEPGDRNPHMHILIDGEQRAEWDVRGEWLPYPQSIPLLKGKHTLSVDNFNNYRADTADRPLVVDWVKITKPTLDGTPRVPAGGSVKVDAAEIQNSVTGQLEKSTLARDGTMWLQWGVGCFVNLAVFEGSGPAKLVPRLKGNVHEGVGSRVQIKLDAKEIDEYHVGEDWEEHATEFTVDAGPHMLEICYDNDEAGKKRNLWLDEMTISSSGTAGPTPTPPTSTPAPVVSPPWRSAHATIDGHRHVASGIDATSVKTAREAWSYRSATVTGTPVVVDGVAYFGDYKGTIHALKVSDGSVVWTSKNDAGVDSSLAVADGVVYAGDQKGWVSARKASDGSLLWRVRADEVEGTHLYGSPVVHDGVLYTGVASEQTLIEYTGPQTFRGSVIALDAKTGAQKWKTYTQDEGGLGVSVWSTPALDPALGLLFVGTGNSYGEPVGKYTDSILALKMSDGSVVWHYQATKGDAFNARGGAGPDRDFGSSPILFEATGRKLVGEGDKGGRFFALDRATGELVWNMTADFRVQGVPASQVEGFLGAVSYKDGVIFAPTTARSMVHAIDAKDGKLLWSRELNELPKKYGDRMFGSNTAAEGVVLQGNAFGRVFALDASTGEILIELAAPGGVHGGISLAGDTFLVPDVGKDLWSMVGGVTAFRVDARAPPVTTSPGPTSPPASTTPGPTTAPTGGPTPSENVEGEGAIGVPGAPVGALLLAILVAGASWGRRVRR